MKLLLDTHIPIWAVANSPRLPESARELIADTQIEIVVSVASLWEIAIKHALRRRIEQMPISAAEGETYTCSPEGSGTTLGPSNPSATRTHSRRRLNRPALLP